MDWGRERDGGYDGGFEARGGEAMEVEDCWSCWGVRGAVGCVAQDASVGEGEGLGFGGADWWLWASGRGR